MSGIDLGFRTVDLNGSVGDWLLNRVDVRSVQRLHLDVQKVSGAWTTAVIELLKSSSGTDFYSLAPAVQFTDDLVLSDIDVHDVQYVQVEIKTAEGAAGVAEVHFYGDGYDAYRSEAQETIDSALATQLNEASATVTYVGKALPGTATSAALWRIFRMTETGGDLSIEYADGDGEFDNVWDNRASLSYS